MMVVAVLPDGWLIGFGIFQLVFSAAVSLAVYRLTAAQRRNEGLEARLHEVTTKLVDERFRAMTHEVNGHVQGLILGVDELKARLKDSEVGIDGLASQDHRIELAVANKFDQLKDFLRDTVAGKDDLQRHETEVARRHDAVDVRMRAVETQVGVLADRLSAR